MATIGTFTKSDAGDYNGAIKTLTLNVKQATLRKAEKDNDKAPDFRIFSTAHRHATSTCSPVHLFTWPLGRAAEPQEGRPGAMAADLRPGAARSGR